MTHYPVSRAIALGLLAAPLAGAPVLTGCALAPKVREAQAVQPAQTVRLDATLARMVEEGRLIGASALVYQSGRETYFGAHGYADREAARFMARDTIVQIYSMTKPVVGVALLTLVEDGRLKLDDPIGRHIPELANLTVFAGIDESGHVLTRPPSRPPTVLDFMRFTAGLGSAYSEGPVGELWRTHVAASPEPTKTLTEFAEGVAKVPLEHEPGAAWRYGEDLEIQALLIERLAGMPLEDYLRKRIFQPLGMRDTGYFVPEDKRARFAQLYERDQTGAFKPAADFFARGLNTQAWARTPGGFGLTSTLDDYMRFARMLLNGGELEGVRILRPETVRLMTSDQLGAAFQDRAWLAEKGVGFGLNVAVRTAPVRDAKEPYGPVGQFYWEGYASTSFWVDPANELAVVVFTQVIPFQADMDREVRRAVYGAEPAAGQAPPGR